jgi:hypothetical protein
MGTGGSSAVCAVLALVVIAACAESGAESSSKDGRNGGGQAGDGGCSGVGCGAAGGGSGGTGGAPPEREVESAFRSPVATGRFVWATNPASGRVARIDASSFEVRTVAAGFGPTYLAAVPTPAPEDSPRAIVLNVRSHDATLLVADASGGVTTQTVPVHPGANAWAISARGRWAIAWSDVSQTTAPDPTEGFQDVTVIDLGGAAPRATRLSVGYRPTRLYIAADESRAFAVTEPGITAIELAASGGPMVSRDFAVSDDPFLSPAARDVSVTPDGALAFVRHDGSAVVGIVTLATGNRVSVTMPAAVTDLDLTDDGTRAVAVMRGGDAPPPPDGGADAETDGAGDSGDASNVSDAGDAGDAVDARGAGDARQDSASPVPVDSKVAVLPIPAIATNPTGFEVVTIAGERMGSVALSPDGRSALLYTNAFDNDRMTILSIGDGAGRLSYRTVSLKAPVRAVFAAPDASHAIALLEPGAGSTKPGAFSIVPIASNLPPKIQGTEAVPVSVAIAPGAAGRALVTVSDENARVFATYLARMPELLIDRLPLASAPLATGIVPAVGSGFVAEKHPEGRITFVQLASGQARTLTGFELGAKVVDGQR